MEAFIKTKCYVSDVEWFHSIQTLLKDHALNWWMTRNQKMLNLFNTLMWAQFKLQFNEIFTSHHQVFKDGMELLES